MASDELKTVVLPERDDMLRRLMSVEDEPHLVENFYPLLLKNAGQERAGQGIVMMLVLAVADYTKELPPAVARVLHMRLPDFVDALTDDHEARSQAHAMLRKAGII